MSDLVERVYRRVSLSCGCRKKRRVGRCAGCLEQSRAAIAAVAEWGRSNFYDDKPLHEFLNELSAALRKQLEQPE